MLARKKKLICLHVLYLQFSSMMPLICSLIGFQGVPGLCWVWCCPPWRGRLRPRGCDHARPKDREVQTGDQRNRQSGHRWAFHPPRQSRGVHPRLWILRLQRRLPGGDIQPWRRPCCGPSCGFHPGGCHCHHHHYYHGIILIFSTLVAAACGGLVVLFLVKMLPGGKWSLLKLINGMLAGESLL